MYIEFMRRRQDAAGEEQRRGLIAVSGFPTVRPNIGHSPNGRTLTNDIEPRLPTKHDALSIMELIMINHYALRCAQSKAAIAAFIGDGKMWIEAQDAMKKACGYPLYRRGKK